ncbi:hypothetical protein [Leifsonia sp. TF02-11]|uniref:hypothetical protein n=1 Tax=Leifsonia sp. TF02-11 TaxID=2815212 RepID=UPI001AA17309|nr:hypothetical protein [Leifsonia sp. TF02-11]MBO1741346.1 hypothetical protein [Leifsonia sp. TF02-11]
MAEDQNGAHHDRLGQFTGHASHDFAGDSLTMTFTAGLIATSDEDDAAFLALDDLVGILTKYDGTAVIGGHMVSLLTATFPAHGLIDRRTGDADAGIPVTLAASGALHADLLAAGYDAQSGNRYVKAGHEDPKPTIDLLIPSLNGQFSDEVRGERGFNTMPGLTLALGRTLSIAAEATLQDGTTLTIPTKVPTVEGAVILKSYAYVDRAVETQKDLIDLSNLFHVLDHHGAEKLGGWRLNESELTGSRLDTAKNLTVLATKLESGRIRNPRLNGRRLAFLIRKHVA